MGKFQILPDTQIVRNRDSAEEMLLALDEYRLLAVDTETTGLSYATDYAVVISISSGRDRWVIFSEAFQHIAGLLKDPTRVLILHNAKFDLMMLLNAGIDVLEHTPKARYRIIDTMVLHHMVDDDRPHSLKYAALELLGVRMKEFNEVFGHLLRTNTLGEIFLDPANEEVVAHYAGLDAWTTIHIFAKLKRMLMSTPCNNTTNVLTHVRTQWDLFLALSMKFTTVLYGMERRGFPVNITLLHSFVDVYERQLASSRRDLVHVTRNATFNPDSNAHVAKMLYETLGHECTKFTDSGAPSTDVSVLKNFAAGGCEFSKRVLAHRDLAKRLKTYVLSPLRLAHRGKVFPRYLQTGTGTGRIASREPNATNLPEFIRQAYEGGDGYILYARDYSQVEIRVFAAISQDPVLIERLETGGDPHSAVAAAMFGVSYEEIHEAKIRHDTDSGLPGDAPLLKMRKSAKTINFGLLYGMGVAKLAADQGISYDEAEEHMERYFAAMPSARDAQQRLIDEAESRGYSETLIGSRRQLHGFLSTLSKDLSASERKAKNSPIQGTAAKIVELAMIACYESDVLERHGVELVTQVHDELVFRIPEHEWRHNRQIIEDEIIAIMGSPFGLDIGVPLETTGAYGNNWLEAK